MNISRIRVPIYETNIYVVLVNGKEYSELIGYINKSDANPDYHKHDPKFIEFEGLSFERNHVKGFTDYWCLFPNIKDKRGVQKKITINTISHESFHLTRMITNDRSVLYEAGNDEPFAYLNGYINQQIYNCLPKKLIETKINKNDKLLLSLIQMVRGVLKIVKKK